MDNIRPTILVGRIAGAYGVKGWVRVNSFTEPPENIFSYTPWQLHVIENEQRSNSVKIVEGKPHGKGVVVRLEGIDDRDQAEGLRGMEIRVDRERMPEPESGHYYWSDLEGLRVEDAAGANLGRVDHMMDTGSADVMVVCGEGRHLIPFTVGETVLEVDLEAGCIRVNWDAGE
jgi:16S rRNA processing protein RimM